MPQRFPILHNADRVREALLLEIQEILCITVPLRVLGVQKLRLASPVVYYLHVHG